MSVDTLSEDRNAAFGYSLSGMSAEAEKALAWLDKCVESGDASAQENASVCLTLMRSLAIEVHEQYQGSLCPSCADGEPYDNLELEKKEEALERNIRFLNELNMRILAVRCGETSAEAVLKFLSESPERLDLAILNNEASGLLDNAPYLRGLFK